MVTYKIGKCKDFKKKVTKIINDLKKFMIILIYIGIAFLLPYYLLITHKIPNILNYSFIIYFLLFIILINFFKNFKSKIKFLYVNLKYSYSLNCLVFQSQIGSSNVGS